jgi:hypothetical protein
MLLVGILAQLLLLASYASASPIKIDWNSLVGPNPDHLDPNWIGGGDGIYDASIDSNGNLVISTTNDYSFLWQSFQGPPTDWDQNVNNATGWIVEARLKVDPYPSTETNVDSYNLALWINDNTYLTVIGIDTDKVFLYSVNDDPITDPYSMDTTNDFHTYTVEGLLDTIKVFVDNNPQPVITYQQQPNGGTSGLGFGDFNYEGASLSSWDYLSYDTDPVFGTNPPPAIPEPCTMLLLGSGLVGLALACRRRNRG